MKIALAQINPTVGDLEGNVRRILHAVERGAAQGAELVVLPEMCLPGYPPRDILYDPSFTTAVQAALQDLAAALEGAPDVLVGALSKAPHQPPGHPGLYNTAFLLRQGRAQVAAHKRLLPGYDVFYEPRWFLPGPPSEPLLCAGRRLGVLVCEDMWDAGYEQHPPADLLAAGAEILVCLSASPYRQGTLAQRLAHARRHAAPLVFTNLAGATDELVFDGRSFALDAAGNLLGQLAHCAEDLQVLDLEAAPPAIPELDPQAELFQALVLGVRDFAQKNGMQRLCLGASGGIDSALAAVIAVEALGAANVTLVAIPSRYTDPRSTACARELAETLGAHYAQVELEPLHAASEAALGELAAPGSTAAENIQARLRGMILMAFVNRHGGFLLNTSNKSELALGYSTLYGDMAGAISPLGDLTKPQVYRLARWLQAQRGVFPAFSLERPPSAELRPDQVDPFDYELVGPAMEELVLANRSNPALRRSEHKRWQMGVVLKVSEKAFGSGRMMPITRR